MRLREVEKQELVKRIKNALLKYLIRDPIYYTYTEPLAAKVFSTLRISPRILGLILSIVNYYKYYSYIA